MATEIHSVEIKIRYTETDAMGFVHHSHYYNYFEVARVQAFEDLGHPYQDMEAKDIMIPVISSSAQYKHPIFFGDTVIIKTTRSKISPMKIQFNYEVFRNDLLMATGETHHVFMHRKGQPLRPPAEIIKYFD